MVKWLKSLFSSMEQSSLFTDNFVNGKIGWLDEDKTYELGSLIECDKFALQRNYKFSSDGDDLVSIEQ